MRKLYERFIVAGYVNYGMIVGDLGSYGLGDAGIYDVLFRFFRKRYIGFGYVEVPFAEFMTAGGYVGPSHLDPYLRIKKV